MAATAAAAVFCLFAPTRASVWTDAHFISSILPPRKRDESVPYELKPRRAVSLPRRRHLTVRVIHQSEPKPLHRGGQLTGRIELRGLHV